MSSVGIQGREKVHGRGAWKRATSNQAKSRPGINATRCSLLEFLGLCNSLFDLFTIPPGRFVNSFALELVIREKLVTFLEAGILQSTIIHRL